MRPNPIGFLRLAAAMLVAAAAAFSAVTVTVSPSTVSLSHGQSQQFSATVSGSTFQVLWTISPTLGTISASGYYTAPSQISQQTEITVTATTADGSGRGTARITLIPTVAVSISPSSATLQAGQTQTFVATVTGTSNTAVTWTLSPAVGTIDAGGNYTAPSSVSSSQTVTVTATSAADTTKTATATINLQPPPLSVGQGAPTSAIQQAFQTNFTRNGFNTGVLLPPLGLVQALGSTGYYQEFADANIKGAKWALIMPGASGPVFQLSPDLYAYYNTVGVKNAGYPTADAQACPFFDPNNSCTWDTFSLNYALFAYLVPLGSGAQNFSISGAAYTVWVAANGINGLGLPTWSGTVTSGAPGAATANQITFQSGAIFTITSGLHKGETHGVSEPIYDVYNGAGGAGTVLGLPISDEIILPSGAHRQTFEGASIQYTPGQPPVILTPVGAITLQTPRGSGTIQATVGDVIPVTASLGSSSGQVLNGRVVTWSTSNASVATVQATGDTTTANVTAVGGGVALIRASSEGVASAPLTVLVTSPCCQVGEGAPNATLQQAFKDAVTRNRLKVLLPAPNAVQRLGAGYVQVLQSPDRSTQYLLAKPDSSPLASVVSGAMLDVYTQLGGPTGPLGYPISDISAGGTQLFENKAALAGSPVRLVSPPVLAKWASMGYETGAAGVPAGDAASFVTFLATSGVGQMFQNGAIYGATSGPRAGQAFYAGGLILARYLGVGGPAKFGMPTGDEVVTGAVHRQNFEGGWIDFSAGDSAAVEHASPRTPAIMAAPAVLAPGQSVRLAVSGFADATVVRVSISGQPDFLVSLPNGAFAWTVYVPASTRPGTVSLHAETIDGSVAADGSFAVRSLLNAGVVLTKVRGDAQTGLPGALLPVNLRVAVQDASGAAIPGVAVVFDASPGVTLASGSAVTDANGQAEVAVRLPAAEGVALVNASAPGVASTPVTFAVKAAASAFTNFPRLMQAGDTPLGNGGATIAQEGALLAAVASAVRYEQNRGDLPTPNGLADIGILNQFLTADCAPDATGVQLCDGFVADPNAGHQVVNLWRVADFVGGALSIVPEDPTPAHVRDLLAQGWPVLLALDLAADGTPAGGHFVVAIGESPSGTILIHDPSPQLARSTLDGYLNGFGAVSHNWTATIRSAWRMAQGAPKPGSFLGMQISQRAGYSIQSPAGACPVLDLTDPVRLDQTFPAAPAGVSRFALCDGSQTIYQLDIAAAQPWNVSVGELSTSGVWARLAGAAPATYKIVRPQAHLAVTAMDLTFTAAGVVNAATFLPGIAPDGLMTIFGNGLSASASVTVNGTPAPALAATPFQLTAQVPDMAPGPADIGITSQYGSAHQQVQVQVAAPGIFVVAGGRPAIVNQSGTLNGPMTPAPRGSAIVVYATGLGAVASDQGYSIAVNAVTAMWNGASLTPFYAGLAPGFIGLYQVNVMLPVDGAPGVDQPFQLVVAGTSSNSVPLSTY